jgi:hypothetical protein
MNIVGGFFIRYVIFQILPENIAKGHIVVKEKSDLSSSIWKGWYSAIVLYL